MEPLEPKAWDGRWLAIKFIPATETEKAHYEALELQRARDQDDAAMLARQKYNIKEGEHFMVIALPAEIVTTWEKASAELVVPGPRWYKVVKLNLTDLWPQQESEDEWIREVQKEWYSPKEAVA